MLYKIVKLVVMSGLTWITYVLVLGTAVGTGVPSIVAVPIAAASAFGTIVLSVKLSPILV